MVWSSSLVPSAMLLRWSFSKSTHRANIGTLLEKAQVFSLSPLSSKLLFKPGHDFLTQIFFLPSLLLHSFSLPSNFSTSYFSIDSDGPLKPIQQITLSVCSIAGRVWSLNSESNDIWRFGGVWELEEMRYINSKKWKKLIF